MAFEGISSTCHCDSIPEFPFLFGVRRHLIVKPSPLSIGRVEFVVIQFPMFAASQFLQQLSSSSRIYPYNSLVADRARSQFQDKLPYQTITAAIRDVLQQTIFAGTVDRKIPLPKKFIEWII